MNPEEKLFIPHGVQGVPVDGLGAEMAAVQWHAQDVHFNARASCAVTGAHVLSRNNLKKGKVESKSLDGRKAKTASAPHYFPP